MRTAALRSTVWLVASILVAVPVIASQGTSSLPPPVEMTTQQDHQRLMQPLNITALRPGADPRNPNAPNAVNYDEAKANPYPNLPDPLVLKNGKKVTSAKMWWKVPRAYPRTPFRFCSGGMSYFVPSLRPMKMPSSSSTT